MESELLNRMNGSEVEMSEKSGLFEWFQSSYKSVARMKPDPRVQDWFLMSSIWPTLCLSLGYIFVVKVLGPWMMKNRPPFDLRVPLIIYNGCQVVFSAWLLNASVEIGWFKLFNFQCLPVDYSNTEYATMVAGLCWYYYISKFTEFIDTFCFVLRKKYTHISILHVFHHSLMPVGSWLTVKYVAGGHTTFGGVINVFVHILMYFYYMVAAMGPRFENFLWWKKYLTTIQLIQFALVLVHTSQILFFVECDFPKPFAWFLFVNAFIFFGLFSNFYIQAYLKNRRRDGRSKSMNVTRAMLKSDYQLRSEGSEKSQRNGNGKDDSVNGKKLKYG